MGDVDPRTWNKSPRADGVVLRSPTGRGCIRIWPRFRGAWRNALVGSERTKIVTDDGELACVAASPGGSEVTAVVGAHPMLALRATHVEASVVADLVRHLGLGLGTRRWRLFDYEPPPGWRGIRRVGETRFVHPMAPRVNAIVTVFDARPMSESKSAKLESFLYVSMDARGAESPSPAESVQSAHALSGRTRSSRSSGPDGEPRVRKVAAFADVDSIYQASLDAPLADIGSLSAFDAMVRTFRPLPRPVCRDAVAELDFWAD